MIGELLQELRKDKGVKQADVALVLGVTASAIGSYETEVAEPSLDALTKLADYYDVSIDFLAGRIRSKATWADIFNGFEGDDLKIHVEQILNIFKNLPPHERQVMLDVAKSLEISSKEKHNR